MTDTPTNADATTADRGYYPTAADARDARVPGWNVRCNRCGTYGATWLPGQRPG